MNILQKTLFISDLHLQESQPEITRQFLQLLKHCDSSVDALYILGDLFDVWIGDDDHSTFHQTIIQAFKSLTQSGFPIYFLHGNRDFLIGNKFLQATGIKLLSQEKKIILYGSSVLLMHGDTLCTRDIAYLKARSKTRNIFLQKIFLLLPLALRKKIADKIRQKSMQYTESTPLDIMDVTQDEVERVMQIHDVEYLIHGHTHRPGFHSFSLAQQPALRIVLGAWHNQGSVLEWDEMGNKKVSLL